VFFLNVRQIWMLSQRARDVRFIWMSPTLANFWALMSNDLSPIRKFAYISEQSHSMTPELWGQCPHRPEPFEEGNLGKSRETHTRMGCFRGWQARPVIPVPCACRVLASLRSVTPLTPFWKPRSRMRWGGFRARPTDARFSVPCFCAAQSCKIDN
jgi:hypothetical protein